MIGKTLRVNPLSHALRRASSPERGSFFVWRQGLPVRELPLPSAPAGRSHLPQGDGFSGGGKVSGIAKRRPLGGAGIEQSEMTEGVLPVKKVAQKRLQAFLSHKL